MSLSVKKTCNVAIVGAALALSQHFAGEEVYQGSCFVKEAGALNMKLQMQRSGLAKVTAKSRVPPPRPDNVAVNVVNYSYTGHRSSGPQEEGVDPSDKNVVIVDPAGADFMKSSVRGNQANGLSAVVYRLIRSDGNRSGHYGGYWTKEEAGGLLWHPTTFIPLPAEASTNLKKAGDAFYVYYNKDMVNDEVELTNELSVIHSIGPVGQVYKEESINDFKEILFHTYANAFTQFRDRCHGKKELWINPVSSGIFAPSWMKANGWWKSDAHLEKFAELTAEVVNDAINESKIQGVDIKMHIFNQYEFQFFEAAFKQRFEYTDASVVEISTAKRVPRGRRAGAFKCPKCCGGRPNRETNSA